MRQAPPPPGVRHRPGPRLADARGGCIQRSQGLVELTRLRGATASTVHLFEAGAPAFFSAFPDAKLATLICRPRQPCS